MKDRNLREVLTFDQHFAQARFQILYRYFNNGWNLFKKLSPQTTKKIQELSQPLHFKVFNLKQKSFHNL